VSDHDYRLDLEDASGELRRLHDQMGRIRFRPRAWLGAAVAEIPWRASATDVRRDRTLPPLLGLLVGWALTAGLVSLLWRAILSRGP
jgi:hypothetical protein